MHAITFLFGIFFGLSLSIPLSLAAAAGSSSRNLGVGVILFCPTGFSLKYLLQNDAAIDGAVGWSNDDVDVHGDYLLHRNHLLVEKGWSLNLHYGVGGRILVRKQRDTRQDDNKHDNNAGVRLPLGLDVTTGKLNLEIFGELALIMDFINETSAELGLALGVRYYL